MVVWYPYYEGKEREFDTIKEVHLEMNAEKTKHGLLPSEQNSRKIHDIQIANIKMWYIWNTWERE
jgi:hypothetical protein